MRRLEKGRRAWAWQLAWAAAGLLFAFGEIAVLAVARTVDGIYARDPHWFVAAYAEPWRTGVASIVILLTLVISGRAALRPAPMSWKRRGTSAAVLLAGLAICVELTRAVRYNDALGVVYVHAGVLRRAKVALPDGPGGWGVRVDIGGPFFWRVNGVRIHARLLPLPYDAARFRRGLCAAGGG